nr:ulp1 protease family, C-terminal catalytic domain-containing protein [Tanacetum cinerariifolium]
SDSGYTYASKYKEACDPLVFAMIHMENYFGDAAKNWEFGLCKESDEQLSMLHRLRYKIATKIMLH